MKEVKHAVASTEVKAALHEVLGAFEAFKDANDQRLSALEKKQGDGLLDDKVARIEDGLQSAQARLDRILSQKSRPDIGAPVKAMPEESKAAWDGYLRSGRV